MNHVEQKHTEQKCNNCEFTTQELRTLHHHQMAKHGNVQPRKFPCTLCDKAFCFRSSLRNHVDQKHTEQQCDDCEFTTQELSTLNHHQMANHENVRFNCNKCEQLFQQK